MTNVCIDRLGIGGAAGGDMAGNRRRGTVVRRTVNKIRTPLLTAAFVALPLFAVACSDDSGSSSTSVTAPPGEQPVETDAPDSTPTGSGFQHPTGADEVVIRIGYEGGFVPASANFSRTPTLLVAGDGTVYTPGAITLQYPGPLVLPIQTSTLTEEGVQALLALADEHGLLAEAPEYVRNDLIADAADTVVEITVDGVTYRHQAYALGLEGGAAAETDPARKALAEFVEAASNPASVVPEGSLTDGGLLTGDIEIQAVEVDPANYDQPTITAWASTSGITLADSTECAVVPASDTDATALLGEATSITLFTEGDVTYAIAVRPQLPGGQTC